MRFAPGRSMLMIASTALVVSAGTACESNLGNPAGPSAIGGSFSGASLASSPSGGNAHPLIEVVGSVPPGGGGMLNSVPTAPPGTNVIELTINVHGAPPDTDLYFQIAHDAYLGAVPARGDGICDRAINFGFPNPPLHAGGDAGIIHTSEAGAGSTHVRFDLAPGFSAGAYDAGATLDSMFRLVNLTKLFEVRTDCVSITWR